MGSAEWVFEPTGPRGARKGGLGELKIISPNLDKFLRENAQNSGDQRSGAGSVKLVFRLHELRGNAKQQFLNALDWEDLEAHISASVNDWESATIGQLLQEGLAAVASEPLRLLEVEDSGTWGLTGDEDQEEEVTRADGSVVRPNFKRLCIDSMVTHGLGARTGGSWGVGKSMLWRFSAVSSVLFYSRTRDVGGIFHMRLFGRADLPSHRLPARGALWEGPGWFGARKSVGLGDRAESSWDADAESTASALHFRRDLAAGEGLTSMIIGFRDPFSEATRTLQEIADDLADKASNYFWPAISRLGAQPPSISIEAHVCGECASNYEALGGVGAELENYRRTANDATSGEEVRGPGDVAEVQVPFEIPGEKRSGGAPPVAAKFTLRVRAADANVPDSLRNKIALVRGARMVVAYRAGIEPPEGLAYTAVLLGGTARGDSPEDLALETFLRLAEPEAHDDWTSNSDNLLAAYKQGAGAHLRRLWSDVDATLKRILEAPIDRGTDGPEELARRFRVPGRGSGTRRHPFHEASDAHFDAGSGTWHVIGEVARRDSVGTKWTVDISLHLDADSGRGRPLETSRPTVKPGRKGLRISGGPERWTCEVPATVEKVEFEIDSLFNQSTVTLTDIAEAGVQLAITPSVLE